MFCFERPIVQDIVVTEDGESLRGKHVNGILVAGAATPAGCATMVIGGVIPCKAGSRA